MKVYCSFGLYESCNYVRLWLPMKYNGWVGDYVDLQTRRSPQEATRLMLQSDVVVMHRPFEWQRKFIAETIKGLGKKLVFDNDDTYKDPASVKGNMKSWAGVLDKVLGWFIQAADLVTCTTEFLKSEYEKLNKNVVVLPNMIDPDDWPEPKKPENDKFRVGIIGSVAYDDFRVCYEDLIKLGEEKDIRLVVLGDKLRQYKKNWDNINYEFHSFVSVWEYPQKLKDLKLDLMIIPREDNYFNRCKSAIKFLEASMLEIPVLAQGFSDGNSPYQQNPEDAKHMIIVYKHWYEAVMEAKNNRDYLRKMAANARKYVLENYNIKTKYQLWEKTYKTIL